MCSASFLVAMIILTLPYQVTQCHTIIPCKIPFASFESYKIHWTLCKSVTRKEWEEKRTRKSRISVSDWMTIEPHLLQDKELKVTSQSQFLGQRWFNWFEFDSWVRLKLKCIRMIQGNPFRLLNWAFTGIIGVWCMILIITDPTTLNSNTVLSTIFKEITTLYGHPFSEGGPLQLEKGEHVFPFAFRVPPANLPASYEVWTFKGFEHAR